MTEKKIAVKVDHVSKFFRLPTESTQSLRTALVNRFKGIKGYKEQHVLKDISFEVEEGDFFGIVGRNGSGKSTLLKIISQIYVPEKGSVTVNGKSLDYIKTHCHQLSLYAPGQAVLVNWYIADMDEIYDKKTGLKTKEDSEEGGMFDV